MKFFENILWQPSPPRWELVPEEVHVWKVRLDIHAAEVQENFEILSAEESNRAQRYHFEKDRHHFSVARIQLKNILGKYLNKDPKEIHFTYNKKGKPSLDLSLPPLYFNLSHSRDLCLIAVSRGGEIGVDLEFEGRKTEGLAVASKYFTEKECAWLRSAPPELQQKYFLTLWTLKEATLKARGEGLQISLKSFEIHWDPGEKTAGLHTFEDPVESSQWSLHTFIPEEGYVAAVALQSKNINLKFFSSSPVMR